LPDADRVPVGIRPRRHGGEEVATMDYIIPLISAIVSFVFAAAVLDQYFARRRAYQRVWAIGLLMYLLSTLSEFLWGASGPNEAIYRLWYLFGAILVAAYLGMGTVYLLARRRVAHITMLVLGLLTVYAAVRVFTADVDITVLEGLSGEAMPSSVRALTPVLNVFGTVALVGGALYSAWIFWRKRILPHRVVSNVLIALGAILPAAGGTQLRASGNLQVFYALELAGIIIIFIGFLRSREVFGLYRFPLIHGFGKVRRD
jgi:hypothetical protein